MRTFSVAAAVLAIALLTATQPAAQTASEDPLAIARILAAKYPAQPIMSYIPALSWSNSFLLSALTGEPQWREKAITEMRPFLSGQAPAIAEPYRLTSFAGAFAFADAAALTDDAAALAQRVAAFIVPQNADDVIGFATGWTDDMFMASSVLSRVDNGKYAAIVGRLLTTYAAKLQRADGIFIHAAGGPYAWGRGKRLRLARRDRSVDAPAGELE